MENFDGKKLIFLNTNLQLVQFKFWAVYTSTNHVPNYLKVSYYTHRTFLISNFLENRKYEREYWLAGSDLFVLWYDGCSRPLQQTHQPPFEWLESSGIGGAFYRCQWTTNTVMVNYKKKESIRASSYHRKIQKLGNHNVWSHRNICLTLNQYSMYLKCI